jgi:hypothetical protein
VKDGIKNVTVLYKNGKVPKNQDFFVSVFLPLVKPVNLVPTAEAKQFDSGLLVQAVVFNSTTLAGVATATAMTVGMPLNHPKRKHRKAGERKRQHQTFRFAGLAFSVATATIVFHSVHRYFDDRGGANGVPFEEARTIIAEFPLQVE